MGGFFIAALHRVKRRAAQLRKAVAMTDDKKVDVIETENPAQDDGKDYKAMYEQAIAESAKKTLEERVSDIESRNKALEDEKARAELVKAVASVTGVPESIVSTLSATDEETMTAQANAIAENYKTPGGAPKAPEAGKFPREIKPTKTTAQQFADALVNAGF